MLVNFLSMQANISINYIIHTKPVNVWILVMVPSFEFKQNRLVGKMCR